jgi:WD40 repeat protein
MDDLTEEYEFPIKNCKEVNLKIKLKLINYKVHFSNGGHYIAVVVNNAISLYSSTTFSHVHTLRGHVGQVTKISWSNDDRKIASVSVDGAMYEWSIEVSFIF